MQFAVTIDPSGNLFVNEGTVLQIGTSSTDVFRVNSGIASDNITPSLIRLPKTKEQTFVGGGGFTMRMAGTLSGTNAPVGYFRRVNQYVWESQLGHTIEFDDPANTADLIDIDGSTVLATFSASATIAPVGTFSSTASGATTYNGGTSFTLTSTYEGNGTVPAAVVFCDIFGVQSGTYSPTANFAEWESDDDPNFLININAGIIELSDGTDIIAEGSAITNTNPSGILDATTYGKDNYNSGFDFTVSVSQFDVLPIAGYIYIELTLSSGSITAAAGPFFAASLPSNSTTLAVVPIAYSDGAGVIEQLHEGPILWK